ncbi:MAG TPA: glycerol-3-phosphate acyltransferase, partial [Anaeromyxobacteraceae bacterium]
YLEAYRFTAEALAATPDSPVDRRALVKAALERGRASWAAGRILMRESVSKVTVENAAEWLEQQASTGATDAAVPPLSPGWREQQLPEILRELARHLAS